MPLELGDVLSQFQSGGEENEVPLKGSSEAFGQNTGIRHKH